MKIAFECGPSWFALNGRHIAADKGKTYRIIMGEDGPIIITARKRGDEPMCVIEPENQAQE